MSIFLAINRVTGVAGVVVWIWTITVGHYRQNAGRS